MATTLTPAQQQAAFYASDSRYDGLFYTAVRTTGIFCKPSCTARKPLPQNIVFYNSVREAVFAGYRPCKRCHPLEVAAALPAWAQQLIAHIEAAPEVKISARHLLAQGLQPNTVRRFWQQHFGMTFAAYCRGRRLAQAYQHIQQGAVADHAALDSGYQSLSGFRDAYAKAFGSTPAKAPTDYIRMAWIDTPLGPMVAGATNAGICLLEFNDRRMMEHQLKVLHRRLALPLIPGEHQHLTTLRVQLTEYFAGRRQQFTLPLVMPGTAFEQRVWQALLAIPAGHTLSYEALATRVGSPQAQRAVGHANGCNRISILIPCHRVINKSGHLGGYGGGLWRKRVLLDLERTGQLRLDITPTTPRTQLAL